MKFCTACGSQLADAQVFCSSCGTPRGIPQPAAEPPSTYPPAPTAWTDQPAAPTYDEPRRNRAGLVAAGLLTLIAVAAWGYVAADRFDWFEGSPTAGASAADRDEPEEEQEEEPPVDVETDEPLEEDVESAPLTPSSVTADCVAPPAVDSAGATVTYEPERVLDGDPDTAWRCPGPAVGRRLVFTFDEPVTLTAVGLVPGYDKIDPVDGIDRFTENRTVTGVSWEAGGQSFAQSIPAPDRLMYSLELPEPVETTVLTLEITSTGNDEAARDFTPISDVEFLGY